MPFEALTGLNVSNQYGQRDTGGVVGVGKTGGNIRQMEVLFTGTSLNENFWPKIPLPLGARVLRYVLRVDEVFTVSAAGTVTFGGTAPGTNGVVLTKAELEAVGTKVPTSVGTGTWATSSATGVTASENLTRAISGTVASGSGKATLLVEFVRLRRA